MRAFWASQALQHNRSIQMVYNNTVLRWKIAQLPNFIVLLNIKPLNLKASCRTIVSYQCKTGGLTTVFSVYCESTVIESTEFVQVCEEERDIASMWMCVCEMERCVNEEGIDPKPCLVLLCSTHSIISHMRCVLSTRRNQQYLDYNRVMHTHFQFSDLSSSDETFSLLQNTRYWGKSLSIFVHTVKVNGVQNNITWTKEKPLRQTLRVTRSNIALDPMDI